MLDLKLYKGRSTFCTQKNLPTRLPGYGLVYTVGLLYFQKATAYDSFSLYVGIYKEFGNDYVTSEGNRREIKEGALKIKVSYCFIYQPYMWEAGS